MSTSWGDADRFELKKLKSHHHRRVTLESLSDATSMRRERTRARVTRSFIANAFVGFCAFVVASSFASTRARATVVVVERAPRSSSSISISTANANANANANEPNARFDDVYANVDAASFVRHRFRAFAERDARRRDDEGGLDARRRDERASIVAYVARGRDDEDIARDVLRTLSEDEMLEESDERNESRGTAAANARGGEGVARAIEGERAWVVAYVDRACASTSGFAIEVSDPVQAYLRARGTNAGEGDALVMTCGEAEGKANGETFAKGMEALERAGVRAFGVFYTVEMEREMKLNARVGKGRALLELEEAESPECGLMCETQTQLVTGIIIFWGLLLTLLYGWGLMTDLDTPLHWATSSEDDDKQD